MNLRPVIRIIVRVFTRSQLFLAVTLSATIIVFFLMSLTIIRMPDSLSTIILKFIGPESQIDEHDIFYWYMTGSFSLGVFIEMLYGLRILKRPTDRTSWTKKLGRIAIFLGFIAVIGFILMSLGASQGGYLVNALIFLFFWFISVVSWAWYLSIDSFVEYVLSRGVWVGNNTKRLDL
jgi:hypothetical protein